MLGNCRKFLAFFCGKKIVSNINDASFVEGGKKNYKGFSQFYDANIKPLCVRLEEDRIKDVKQLIFSSWISVLYVVGISVVIYLYFSLSPAGVAPSNTFKYFSCFAIVLLVMLLPSKSRFRNRVKSVLFSEIFKFFGDYVYNPERRGESLIGGSTIDEVYRKFIIMPTFAMREAEDFVSGNYKGVDLQFEELSIFSNAKAIGTKSFSNLQESRKTLFRGAVVILSFNKKFSGQTVVRSSSGKVVDFINSALDGNISSMQKVELEDPEFGKMFEVFSENQIEARYLLTTSFMERLKNLSGFFQCTGVKVNFCENMLLLMFDGSANLFEPGSIFKEINLVDQCRTALDQMGMIFEIIEILKLDQRTAL